MKKTGEYLDVEVLHVAALSRRTTHESGDTPYPVSEYESLSTDARKEYLDVDDVPSIL